VQFYILVVNNYENTGFSIFQIFRCKPNRLIHLPCNSLNGIASFGFCLHFVLGEMTKACFVAQTVV